MAKETTKLVMNAEKRGPSAFCKVLKDFWIFKDRRAGVLGEFSTLQRRTVHQVEQVKCCAHPLTPNFISPRRDRPTLERARLSTDGTLPITAFIRSSNKPQEFCLEPLLRETLSARRSTLLSADHILVSRGQQAATSTLSEWKPHHQLLTADEQRASPGSALHTRSVKRAVSDQKLSLVHCLASDSDHYLNNTESLILPIEPASCR
ncbi:unnamed protein product, partial [Mesorhabditis spiculigera]